MSLSMYCPKELKLNKFREVKIPSNASYFQRYGFAAVPSESLYTGDEELDYGQTKLDAIAEGAELYERFAASEDNK